MTAPRVDDDPLVRLVRHPIVLWTRRAIAWAFPHLLTIAFFLSAAGTWAKLVDWPTTQWWTQNAPSMSGWLFLAGLGTAMSARLRVGQLERRNRVLRERVDTQTERAEDAERRRQNDELLKSLLTAVHQATGLNPVTLGSSVWLVPPDPAGPALQRLTNYQFHSRQSTRIAWTKGKGTIGQCWESEVELVTNPGSWRDLQRGDFEALTEDKRLGMSWQEYQATAAYSAVWAVPLKDHEGRLRGVLSVDCDDPSDGVSGLLKIAKDDKVVIGLVTSVSRLVAAEHVGGA